MRTRPKMMSYGIQQIWFVVYFERTPRLIDPFTIEYLMNCYNLG